jgi:hypothetical protein
MAHQWISTIHGHKDGHNKEENHHSQDLSHPTKDQRNKEMGKKVSAKEEVNLRKSKNNKREPTK